LEENAWEENRFSNRQLPTTFISPLTRWHQPGPILLWLRSCGNQRFR